MNWLKEPLIIRSDILSRYLMRLYSGLSGRSVNGVFLSFLKFCWKPPLEVISKLYSKLNKQTIIKTTIKDVAVNNKVVKKLANRFDPNFDEMFFYTSFLNGSKYVVTTYKGKDKWSQSVVASKAKLVEQLEWEFEHGNDSCMVYNLSNIKFSKEVIALQNKLQNLFVGN